MKSKSNDAAWKGWVASMVATVREAGEMGEADVTDAGEAYDILKTNFRADAPSREMFEAAAKEALGQIFPK